MSDGITIERPEGMSEGRWTALAQQAHVMLTGHMPWCTDHREDADDQGWCFTEFTIKDVCVVDVSNGTLDGTTRIGLYLDPKLELESLSIREAGVIAGQLENACRIAKLWNTGLPEGPR